MVALTGHDGGANFLQVFKQMTFVARMMYAAHHKALSPRAKQLLALCDGDPAPWIEDRQPVRAE